MSTTCAARINLPPSFLLPFLPYQTIRTVRTAHTIKTISAKTNRFNRAAHLPILGSTSTAALERKAVTTPYRTGVIAVKKGMSAIYHPTTGRRTPCTIVQLDRVQVVGHKTRPRHGYWAVQVGYGWRHPSNITRPMLGYYAGQQISPKKELVEFRVKDETGLVKVGEELGANWFVEGQFVDVRGNCKGKGFAGGMKRHGWSGQPASHGNSLAHRVMGSSGPSQGGGSRVHPGKNMPGRMGGQQVTVKNVKIMKVDEEHGILVLHGCISGPNGSLVKLQDAIKKPWPDLHSNIPPPKSASPLTTTEATAA
ncbi:MAG: 54S ribosomal protein L9, mitochondrial [Watsoniomyces obsoletus]|nr:MAG: 54S ribosomal protein L9, mitochondrial [Watsoniomyces obsoletus]